MATKKSIIELTRKDLGLPALEERLAHKLFAGGWGYSIIDAYVELDRRIKALEEDKAVLADIIKGTMLAREGYDPAAKYSLDGLIKTYHRASNELDQMATFKAMKSPKLRDLLFPNAVLFKPGQDKHLASAHDLLIRTWSENPVVEVAK